VKCLKPLIYSLIILTASCKTGSPDRTADGGKINEYSDRFIINQKDGYSILTVINPWQGAKDRHLNYYISDDISKIPSGTDSAQIIIRPLKSIVCTSTTHIAMLDTLGGIEILKGVSGAEFVYNKELKSRIENHIVYDIGYENSYNSELIYSINPDVVLVYGVGSESVPAFTRLSDMGITVLYIADYLEYHPLARTEWIKVFGELLGKQDAAERIFNSVCEKYEEIVKKVAHESKSKPDVLLGLPFKDKWFISPGNSYIAKLIEDAGGKYLWAEAQSDVSIPMSLEAVCQQAIKADIWLNTGVAQSIGDIRSVDPRLGDLQVTSEGSVFNNNRRLNKYGGNDYWESGIINPHIILRDLAYIFNPDIFPGHELIYYTELRDQANSSNNREYQE